jgi:cell division septum initiation protein DivIVA
MNDNSDLLPNFLHEPFETQMRGYSRRQVEDYIARQTHEMKDLEQRLARALDEAEHLRREISTVRQSALAGRPAHEEVSERIAQILKLADDEAKAQRGKADDEISKLRGDAQHESDRVRADAREQAERMLTAAQEQAERTIAAARSESEKLRTSARTEADRVTTDARKNADSALAEAKSQAKRVLDEATARASAIHDGAERRLSLLSTRHTETVRRLSDILEGVQGLVAAETSRMSLEDEVSQSVSSAVAALEPPKPASGPSTDPVATSVSGTPAPPAHEPPATGPNARPSRHARPSADTSDLPFGSRSTAPSRSTPDTDPVSALGASLPGVPGSLGTSGAAGSPATPRSSGPISSAPIGAGPAPAGPTGSGPAGTTSSATSLAWFGDSQDSSSPSSGPLPPPPAMPRRLGGNGDGLSNGGSFGGSGNTGTSGSSESGSQDPLSMPSAPPLTGSIVQGPPPPDSVPLPSRESKQDSHPLGRHGLSDPDDPDDPDEGLRLLR